jgi:hypothetical protein
VVKDEEAHDQARAAIGKAAVLPKDDLGFETARQ